MLALDQTGPYLFQVRHGVALATGQDDVIDGGAGNDTLIGGPGNDTIAGGSGWDTAVYSGNYDEYQITETDTGWTVKDNRQDSPDGTDTISDDVENLEFADQTVSLVPTAEEIFIAEGNDGLRNNEAYFTAGMMRVMADFMKASYSLEESENRVINDENGGADTALTELYDQGWQPVFDLIIPGVEATTILTVEDLTASYQEEDAEQSGLASQMVSNGFSQETGLFTNGNAAALILRSGDSLVLSFRGTNDTGSPNDDSGILNTSDPNNIIYPDRIHWGGAASIFDSWSEWEGRDANMSDHYALFAPLITAIENYVGNADNGINHVYATGHSLGGAMAIEFTSQHEDMVDQTITFAAPAFTNENLSREEFEDLDNLTQVEILFDPVPMTWDSLGGVNRPGQLIRLAGDGTSTPIDENFDNILGADSVNSNHSTNYYRTITDAIDSVSWQAIINGTDAQDIYLDGMREVENREESFVVSVNDDVITYDPNWNDFFDGYFGDEFGFDAYYGGNGNDHLTGGEEGDILFGGGDNDRLAGRGGDDIFYGGSGNDRIHGGEGTDTVVYASSADNYDFAIENWALTVKPHDTNETDTLYSIEQLGFGGEQPVSVASELSYTNNQLLHMYAPILAMNADDYVPTRIEAFLDHAILFDVVWGNNPLAVGNNISGIVYEEGVQYNINTFVTGTSSIENAELVDDVSNLLSEEFHSHLIRSNDYYLDFISGTENSATRVDPQTEVPKSYGRMDTNPGSTGSGEWADSNENQFSFDPTVIDDQYGASVYGRVVTPEAGDAIYLQYYFFYLENHWTSPISRGFHEADWEFMQIELDKDTLLPDTFMSSIHLDHSQNKPQYPNQIHQQSYRFQGLQSVYHYPHHHQLHHPVL
ncbi:hypothetical protein TI05_13705 [Achromatium sp. WMS3]|nr:hypothetical protein TI05_13705 [Achromatium sp. WMS3]